MEHAHAEERPQMTDHDLQPIAWREAGSGETIVFLHGMPGSRTAWDRQLEALSTSYRCVAWDMPCYGSSSAIDASSGFPIILDALQDFVTNRLGGAKVHLVGLSLGGMIAMHAAARGDDYIRSIAVLDASPCFGFGGGSDADEFVASVIQGLKDAPSVADFAAAIIPTLVGPNCSKALIDEATGSMVRATAQGLELSARLIAGHDVRDGLGDIKVPALVMAGEHDQDTPFAYAQFIADDIANSTLACIPDAGHLSSLENASFVNSQLEAFLSQV